MALAEIHVDKGQLAWHELTPDQLGQGVTRESRYMVWRNGMKREGLL